MKRGNPNKRVIRRHHRSRLLNKWIKRVTMEFKGSNVDGDIVYINRRARYLIQTPCPCSCAMCGNSRRHFGERTIQERRLDIE